MPRKKAAETKQISITWKRSAIGRTANQKATIAALGLRRLNQTVVKQDSPAIRGMIETVQHLVEVTEG